MARRRRERSDVGARVLAAIPAIAFAIFIVAQGGLIFALGLIALGVLAMSELYTMMARVRPPSLAGFLALAGLALTALYAKHPQDGIVLVLVLSVPLTFFLALLRPRRENVSWAMAVTFLGIVWIGLGVAHAVLLRGLPHGGGLVLDVLIGTFIGDTAAYFGGRAWGRRKLAPRISPNKTLEGLLTGIVGGTLAFWLFAVAYQHDWFLGPDALLIGFCVALAGPVGDLFESLIKRDLEVKDTGRFFGAHGGVLDRLDAVLFTVVAGYYVSRAVLG
ncbi:MAG: phosphatidate cytidylyltransferase [Thermoleophilaceae bacterium]|jgi:phosphatidate cytidylyltransferase|nr:phosphatidate cytidylyltransferase [Thermoleophilaceae bacterium]